MVVRNRRPRETVPGHSQKIEVKCCWREIKTGEGAHQQTSQVGGDRRRKKSKTGE